MKKEDYSELGAERFKEVIAQELKNKDTQQFFFTHYRTIMQLIDVLRTLRKNNVVSISTYENPFKINSEEDV